VFVVPHPPGPVLSRIGDSEPALGLLSGLFIHNHPSSACSRGCVFITNPRKCVMHREDGDRSLHFLWCESQDGPFYQNEI
jgi:hypothetical protein